MLDNAQPHLLRVIGPNCLGIMVPHAGLNASFAKMGALPGRLAFVTQSGAVATAVVDWARERGIGFSHLVSLGDMSDVDFGDMLDYLATDALALRGGRLAELHSDTLAALDKVLPSNWSHGNPVDIIGDAPAKRYEDSLKVLLEDHDADAVLVLSCPTAMASGTETIRCRPTIHRMTRSAPTCI